MKKLFVFAILILCLLSTLLFNPKSNPLFEYQNVEKVCFVSTDKFDNAEIESVVCGDKFFNYCSLETAKRNLQEFEQKTEGLQFYFNNVDVDSVLNSLNATFVYSEPIDDFMVYYAYTTFYDDCVFLNGKKINVQIATYQDKLIVGFPMILTGF